MPLARRVPLARRAAHDARVAIGLQAARRAIADARGGPAACRPSAYHALLRLLASGCDSVIDVGTGDMRSLRFSPCRNRVGVEAHRPYLEHRAVDGPVPVHADAMRLSELFVPGAADLVTMLDVLEHLDIEQAAEVLRQIETIAARRVVLATPRGFFEQDAHDVFALGLGGEELQAHRSGWEVADFIDRGYRVIVIEGFHGSQNQAFRRAYSGDTEPVDGLVAWKETR